MTPSASLPMQPAAAPRRAIAAWLLACCALVFAMVVVGGMTRLTHSGLSIVEWAPIVGTLPPVGDAQWEETFAKYKATPEFRLRNHDMTLEGFKGIFWWEYFHRLLGRLIGVAFLLPYLYFLSRGAVRGRLAAGLAGIFALGALQGALGWYMVKSGLVEDPMVSPVRLSAHLGMAFLIYGSMLWVALGLLAPPARAASGGLRRFAAAVAGIVLVMVLTGALVAGIKAGYAYNTWPLMNGAVVPDEILMLEPWWKNFAFNMATVQFTHRMLALAVLAAVAALWWRAGREPGLSAASRTWRHALLAMALVQVSIGIATLVLRVPLPLAALHQAGAVLVMTFAVGFWRSLVPAGGLQR